MCVCSPTFRLSSLTVSTIHNHTHTHKHTQNGGAYIFRPSSDQTIHPINPGAVELHVVRGDVVTEVCTHTHTHTHFLPKSHTHTHTHTHIHTQVRQTWSSWATLTYTHSHQHPHPHSKTHTHTHTHTHTGPPDLVFLGHPYIHPTHRHTPFRHKLGDRRDTYRGWGGKRSDCSLCD
jgi:hypothetical protein